MLDLWLYWIFFLLFSFIILFLFFNFIILYWFCNISIWIHHRYTRVPHPEPSSLPIPSFWVVPVHQPQASSIASPGSMHDIELFWGLILYLISKCLRDFDLYSWCLNLWIIWAITLLTRYTIFKRDSLKDAWKSALL